jgi:hypothetical protein
VRGYASRSNGIHTPLGSDSDKTMKNIADAPDIENLATPPAGAEGGGQTLTLPRLHKPIYHDLGSNDEPWIDFILSKAFAKADPSAQSMQPGTKEIPFDMQAAKRMALLNPHHAACLRAKAASMVGMGFVVEGDADPDMEPAKKRKLRSTPSKMLDALCTVTFQDVMTDIAEDYSSVGNGYMEVVRADGDFEGPLTGIYQVPAPNLRLVVEGDKVNFHYEEVGSAGKKKFARFGDLADYVERHRVDVNTVRVAEIIHFRQASSLNRWYGMPDWLSAISSMELVKALHQHTHDFFLNRAVPEFILFLLGKKLGDDNWAKIQTAMRAQIGLGNSHKSMVLNLTDPEMKVELHKLAMDGGSDAGEFATMSDALALEIVTAHGVPPLLAGIQIPGKLGATNELPNALRAFQLLLIGPAQQSFSSILDCTLGDSEINGNLGLSEGDFVLRAITDELDVDQMDTSSSMRQTEEDAKSEGRDMKEGLKKELEGISPEDLAKVLGDAWAAASAKVAQTLLAG